MSFAWARMYQIIAKSKLLFLNWNDFIRACWMEAKVLFVFQSSRIIQVSIRGRWSVLSRCLQVWLYFWKHCFIQSVASYKISSLHTKKCWLGWIVLIKSPDQVLLHNSTPMTQHSNATPNITKLNFISMSFSYGLTWIWCEVWNDLPILSLGLGMDCRFNLPGVVVSFATLTILEVTFADHQILCKLGSWQQT